MNTQIKHRLTGTVLFECEAPEGIARDLHMRHAAENAAKSGADLSMANLSMANLYGADLSMANLSGANLSRANLYGADLSMANLSMANLSRANLYGAYLSGANLSRANLSGANLYGAYLSGANLSRANLSGVDLYGANLSRANLYGATVNGLKLIGERPVMLLGPIGSEQRTVYAYITEKGLHIKAGCFFGTADEFLAQLEKTHGDNEHAQEYTAALMYFGAHADLWTPATEAIKEAA